MSDIVVIRPGSTDFDEQNRIQGSLDLPLNRRGQQEVEQLVVRLRELRIDIVFSAPCEAARSTALALCDACGAAFKEIPDFRNLDHGLWQGLQVDDARRKYPKVFKQWRESPETVCLPEGETVAEAVKRIQRALRKCLKRKRTVAIVASEPLATLIGCVLRHCRPELPESTSNGDLATRIEFLHVRDDQPKSPGEERPAEVSDRLNGAFPKAEAPPRNGHRTGAAPKTNGSNGRSAKAQAADSNGSESPSASTNEPRGVPE